VTCNWWPATKAARGIWAKTLKKSSVCTEIVPLPGVVIVAGGTIALEVNGQTKQSRRM
jgi:hypothetical protein